MRSSAANDLMGQGHVYKGSGPHFKTKGRARYNQLSPYCTTINILDGVGRITYRETAIVIWTADSITLNTGGWDTVTTRRKMNQASHQFGLGFSVWRNKGLTYAGFQTNFALGQQFTKDAIAYDGDIITIDRKTGAMKCS